MTDEPEGVRKKREDGCTSPACGWHNGPYCMPVLALPVVQAELDAAVARRIASTAWQSGIAEPYLVPSNRLWHGPPTPPSYPIYDRVRAYDNLNLTVAAPPGMFSAHDPDRRLLIYMVSREITRSATYWTLS